jgi:phage head maturation protease
MIETITVQVVGRTVQYRAEIGQFGEHLAQGGKVISLTSAQRDAKAFFRANHSPIIKAATYWVSLDESGLAYQVDINRKGQHTIRAAAPMPGADNVKDVYVA